MGRLNAPHTQEEGARRGWRGSRAGGDREPIVDLLNRGDSVAGSRRERLMANGVARKWRRNGLKRLNERPEMVWARKRRTHKIWYTGAG
jgi:hypothetical protein